MGRRCRSATGCRRSRPLTRRLSWSARGSCDGFLLVRELIDTDTALSFAREIDRAFAERERHEQGARSDAAYYEAFRPQERFGAVAGREWIKEGGGVLAVDAPQLCFEMMELFGAAGVPDLVAGYLGEPPLISAHKTTLRKAEPTSPERGTRMVHSWARFVRSTCGCPCRAVATNPRVSTSFRGASIARHRRRILARLRRLAGEGRGGRWPRRDSQADLRAGRRVFFDELFLHQTGSDPSMPKPRFAIESWFFGGSAFPTDYAPVAV